MKKSGVVFVAAVVIFGGTAQAADSVQNGIILDNGSFWRCHQTLRDPVFGKGADAKPLQKKKGDLHWNSNPPPADWMTFDFDDSNWWRSPAPFYGGYGFSSQNNIPQPNTIALISLRGRFMVEDPAKVNSLTFSAAYRGGIVIYLNGTEVKRAQMPEGELAPDTLADGYPIEAYVVDAAREAAEKAAKIKKPENKKTDADKTTAEEKVAEETPADKKVAPTPAAPTQAKAISWGFGEPEKYRNRCELRIRRVENVVMPSSLLRKGMNVLAIGIHRAPYPDKYWEVRDWWGGFSCHAGLLSAQLKTDSPDAVSANNCRPRGFQVWNANPMMAIFDMDYGDPGGQLNPIRIPCARNGRFSGQVVVSCDAAIKGLQATIGDLTQKGGAASISSTNVQIRYAKPGGLENGAGERYGTGEVSRFDPLEENAPDEAPVYAKRFGRKPNGAVQPVWVTVAVPPDAAGGEYAGKLTIHAEGRKDVEVPVVAVVADWKLPDTKDYVTFVDMVESPESLALYYNVPLWSDKHWALIDKTFQQLGRIGNKTVYIPLINKTHFGNSETMVRLVKQADGTFKNDFTIMEKYLDIAQKYLGKPPVVCLDMWDHFSGGGYFNAKTDSSKWASNQVSMVDFETKKVVDYETPRYNDPAAETFWQPVCAELVEIMKKRGLENSIMLGPCSDVRPAKEVVELWKKLLPNAKWVSQSHALALQLYGSPIGYCTTVWNNRYASDPDFEHTYGWNRKPDATIVARFHRDLMFSDVLTQNRLLPENNIGGAQCGFGRNGADFFPPYKNDKGQRTGMLANRYPQSNWTQLSLKTCFLAPGPNGAVGTVRFELTREGVQECEARIFIEKILLNKTERAKLGAEKAGQIQTLLDERIRAGLWGDKNYGWYVSSGWQDGSEKLYLLAAEVAKLVGK